MVRVCAVDACEKRAQSKGYCGMHWMRLKRNGSVDAVKVVRHEGTPAERWAQKYVVDESGCWLWTAAINNKGYGTFCGAYAHRLGYELIKGPIPQGFEIDHLCRTPSCVNPDHLEAVTHQENQLRGNSPCGINARKTHCKRGHPLVAPNLLTSKGRECKTCHRERQMRYYYERTGRS